MKKTTKILLLLLCVLTFTLTGCTEKNIEGTLPEIIDKINEKMIAEIDEENRPSLITVNVEEDFMAETEEEKRNNVIAAIGTADINYKEIYESKPMMSSIPYSVVLVRMEENADIEAAKTAIKENVNPRKWGCVEVAEEDIIVKSKGDIIILIMIGEEQASIRELIEEGFDNL